MNKKEQKELAKQFYTVMYRTRRFEEEVFEFYKRGLMPGLAHLYLGEEAIAAGACATLREDDYIGSTHRGHGHLVARGADLNRMMAEILGKETGYSKGKGGSMHIMAMDKGILGANGIVGGEIPIATGAAYSAKLRGTDQVTLAFFGDSASNEGTFHESINMAAVWKLPCIYVVENNQFGMTVPVWQSTSVKDISVRGAAYGIPGETVDGNDVVAVYDAFARAKERALKGEGPSIIECKTYRWRGHWTGDPEVYRTREEVEDWKKNKDPIKLFREYLIRHKLATKKELDEIDAAAAEKMAKAVEFAVNSPEPDPAHVLDDVFYEG